MNFLSLPYALAQADTTTQATQMAWGFVQRVNDVILFPLITLMLAVAFLVFLYGCFEFIMGANNETARETGRKHILWGIIGLFVMLTAYSLLMVAANTFGLQGQLNCADNPTASGCESVFRLPTP